MAAKYDFKTSPDIQGEKEQPTLYPQIVVSGTKNLKDLAKDIARRSTVHEGTVVGLLCDLESIIANYLADGYNVKLGELGTFSATLTCRKVTDKSEIRAASVHFDNIKFKPTRKFRKEVRSKGKLERAEYGFRTSSTRYSAEERFVRLTNYLKEHSIITCKEYCALTGLLKTKAGSELRQWSSEKKIERKRTRPARDIQGDAGRLKRYPFTCFPLSRNLYSFRVRLVAMRYAPSRISGTLSHCPMLKVISASSATCGFFINSRAKRVPKNISKLTPVINPTLFCKWYVWYITQAVTPATRQYSIS